MRRADFLFSLVAAVACCAAAATPVLAGPVGERHLLASDSSAALRDSKHRSQVRVTVWYPAAAGSAEQRIDIGPPGKPLFVVGAVAEDAPFADAAPRPVILFSHGFGGTARMMAWYGLPLARAGYVVVAVDHPGNNGLDKMTAAGAILSWDRADDLRAALAAASADPAIGPHMDVGRLGVTGFSAGGYTSLVAAGARSDPQQFVRFCRANPNDGICRPQKEFALNLDEAQKVAASPEVAPEIARAGDDRAIPGLRAVFVIAPAIVQELTPASLREIKVPVGIILGDADPIAPPATNGQVAAALIPGARIKVLPGVGHYDFLSPCTPAGRAVVPVCNATVPQDASHQAAIDMALAHFARVLGPPPALGD